MKRILGHRRASGGYTLIEMMVAVAIIAILVAIVSASYDTLKARTRYSKIKADMDAIAQSAYNDFNTHDNTWAAAVFPGTAPSFVNNGDLVAWPMTPCPGWMYSWDNWLGLPANVARVTIRRADLTAIYSYCLQSMDSNCLGADFFGGVPADITSIDNPYIYCNE